MRCGMFALNSIQNYYINTINFTQYSKVRCFLSSIHSFDAETTEIGDFVSLFCAVLAISGWYSNDPTKQRKNE